MKNSPYLPDNNYSEARDYWAKYPNQLILMSWFYPVIYGITFNVYALGTVVVKVDLGELSQSYKTTNRTHSISGLRLYSHSSTVCSLAVSPDGKILASGSEDGLIRLWSLKERNILKSFKKRAVFTAFNSLVVGGFLYIFFLIFLVGFCIFDFFSSIKKKWISLLTRKMQQWKLRSKIKQLYSILSTLKHT